MYESREGLGHRQPHPGERASPGGLIPGIAGVDVTIARIDPGYVTGKPVEEIRHRYVDAINARGRAVRRTAIRRSG